MVYVLTNGVMGSVLASSEVVREFDLWSGKTKDNIIGVCCFAALHSAWMNKIKKIWLPRNQDNVSEMSDIHVYMRTSVYL
jgi:hypothetical protein